MADDQDIQPNPDEPSAGPADAPAPADDALDALQAAQDAVSEVSQLTGSATGHATGSAAGTRAADTHAPPRAAGTPFELPDLGAVPAHAAPQGIDLLGDVSLDVRIELGRTRMFVEDVLRLGTGSVVELDKLAGDPVDVYVNNRPVARGEVLVLNDTFCVRISEVLGSTGLPVQSTKQKQ